MARRRDPDLRRESAPPASSSSASTAAAPTPPLAPLPSLGEREAEYAKARERIFGWARPSKNFTPFKSLSNLKRKGLKGPSIVRYYPEPSPVAKSLVISRGFNEERIEKNILNRTMGRGPPKKGAGKLLRSGRKGKAGEDQDGGGRLL